ncbi:MAG: putative lipid II flippase FtsW [Deltaproteobacteria bacterium]|nr:putative lipid II flippase FtsW [Deltaproteobacteria bacterium]
MPTDADTTVVFAPDAHYDRILLASAFSLMFLGLGIIFTASNIMAQANYGDPFYFIKRQGMYAVLGVVALLLGRKIDYHNYQRWVYPFLFLSLFCLILVFLPGIGGKVRGAARWIRLGPFTLQPSEFAKIAVVMFLAYSFTHKQEKMKHFAIGFLPHMLVAGLVIGLIGIETDFGTALTLAAIVFTMLFVGGTNLAHISLSLGAVISLAVVAVWKDPKKFDRILSFLDPWKYGDTVGYQLKQSLLAIGSGNLLGMGLGQSRAKLFYLPDAHTDFILSIFTEELGFLGLLLVLVLFGILVARGLRLSLKAPDIFGSYLALGLTLVIGLPAAINMGVVSGMLPTKGLSLPFLSYGGSSMIASMLAVGILLNISSQIKRPAVAPAAKTAAPAPNGAPSLT